MLLCGIFAWNETWIYLFILNIYLFIWLCQVLVAGCKIFSCGIQSLSCCIWDLVPWSWIEPGPPALGAWNLSHWTAKEVPKPEFNHEETTDKWETFSYNWCVFLFIYWLCWAFFRCSDWGLLPSCGTWALPLCRLLLLWSIGSWHVGFSSCSMRAR